MREVFYGRGSDYQWHMSYDAGIFSFLFFYFYRDMMMLSCDFAIIIGPVVSSCGGFDDATVKFLKNWFG